MRRLEAYTTYMLMQGVQAFLLQLIFTVNMVYQVTVVGLNPLQLVLVGTTLEVTAFLAEVPTGVVADTISRRLSVIIGFALIGLGFILEGTTPLFESILLAQVLWGIGITFTSGAREAWLSDEIGEHRAGHAFLRGSQVSQAGALAGIVVSAAIATVHLQLPIVLGGAMHLLLALFLVLFMPESGFTPTPRAERTTWETMIDTTRNGARLVRGRPVLLTILALMGIYGLFSEGFDRLWTKHLIDNFTLPGAGAVEPVIWFGVIAAITMILTIMLTEFFRRRVNTNNQALIVRILPITDGLIVVGIVTFALTRNVVVALCAYMLSQVLRESAFPLFLAWSNLHVDSKVRATVLSMAGQANAVGQIAGGPAIGYIGNTFSLRLALLLSGLILSPALLLYRRSMRRADHTTLPPRGPAVEAL